MNRLIRAGFKLLGLQTYFTAGVKEVRAWTIHYRRHRAQGCGRDPRRLRARLHPRPDHCGLTTSSPARGAGRWTTGKMRAEGKEYVVKDGDVMNFLFNV